MDTYWFSKKTFEQLQVKYEALKLSKKTQYDLLNQAIQMDHSSNNLTEEFLKYKEIQKTLQQIEEVIQRAKIIEDSPAYQKRLPNEVHVGTVVTLQLTKKNYTNIQSWDIVKVIYRRIIFPIRQILHRQF